MGIVGTVSLIGMVGFFSIFFIVGSFTSAEVKKKAKFNMLMMLSIAVIIFNIVAVLPASNGRVITESTSSPQYKYNEDGSIKHKSNGDYDIKYNFSEEVVGRESPSSTAKSFSWLLMFLSYGLALLALIRVSDRGSALLDSANTFLQQALLKLRESSVVHKIYPYVKWGMYACELFFILSIFFTPNIGRGISILCFCIFIASLILLYVFKDDKNLFYGTSIYIGIKMIEMIFFSVLAGSFFSLFMSILYSLPTLIIFGLIAYFARKRLPNMSTENIPESDEGEKGVNKLIAAAPFILVVLIFVCSAVSYALSPQVRFDAAIDKGNIEKALEIYEKTPEKLYKTAGIEKLEKGMTDLTEGYINGDADYDDVMVIFKAMLDMDDLKASATEAMGRINGIKVSREAFDQAVAAEKNGDLVEAFLEYKKVVSGDKDNYAVAADKIKKITPKIKELAFSEIKENIEKGDYLGAKKAVNKSLVILPNDSELLSIQEDIDPQAKSILLSRISEKVNASDFSGAKPIIAEALTLFKDDENFLNLKANVDNVLYSEKVEKARTKQLVAVERAEVIVQNESLKELYPDIAQILVKNLSDKVVKNFTVAYCGIDKDGNFVKLKTKNSETAKMMKTVRTKGANIQPGSTYQEKSVEFSSDMRIIAMDACVKSVDFVDGTTWENPYYKFWNAYYLSYIDAVKPKSTSTQKSYSNSSSDSSRPSSKPSSEDGEESGFESYLKENDPDSYDYYQELEKRWDGLE